MIRINEHARTEQTREKFCSVCRKLFSVDKYYSDKSHQDWLQSRCVDCHVLSPEIARILKDSSMKRNYTSLGFTIAGVALTDGGPKVTQACFHCTKCPAVGDIRIKTGSALNPEAYALRMRADGWTADASRSAGTLCPACSVHKLVNDPDSELKKVKLMPPAPLLPPTPTSLCSTASAPNLAASVDVVHERAAAQPGPEKETAPAVAPRPLTSEQRFAARQFLDKHFDDKDGMYLDGMSDHKIAEQLNIPRIHVEQMRELAYGPIRVDQEAMQIKIDLNEALVLTSRLEEQFARFHRECEATMKAHNSALLTMDGRIRALQDRVNKKNPA